MSDGWGVISDEWWMTSLMPGDVILLSTKGMVCRFLGNGSTSKLKLYHENRWKQKKNIEGQKIHWGDLHQKSYNKKTVTEEGCGVVCRYEVHGVVSDEWWMVGDDWVMMSDEWQVTTDEWRLISDDWWVISGEWRLIGGEWWMRRDQWWVVSDERDAWWCDTVIDQKYGMSFFG